MFEVDPFDTYNNLDPQPITGMGRFAHEAVAVDPETGVVYLTEDASNPHGLVYRFVPNTPLGGYGSLARRRRAHVDAVLAVRDVRPGSVRVRRARHAAVGRVGAGPRPVRSRRRVDAQAVRVRRSSVHAARWPDHALRKFEGMWWADGKAFIVTSFARMSDGSLAEHDGQVWSYHPKSATLRLEVRFAAQPR